MHLLIEISAYKKISSDRYLEYSIAIVTVVIMEMKTNYNNVHGLGGIQSIGFRESGLM